MEDVCTVVVVVGRLWPPPSFFEYVSKSALNWRDSIVVGLCFMIISVTEVFCSVRVNFPTGAAEGANG